MLLSDCEVDETNPSFFRNFLSNLLIFMSSYTFINDISLTNVIALKQSSTEFEFDFCESIWWQCVFLFHSHECLARHSQSLIKVDCCPEENEWYRITGEMCDSLNNPYHHVYFMVQHGALSNRLRS